MRVLDRSGVLWSSASACALATVVLFIPDAPCGSGIYPAQGFLAATTGLLLSLAARLTLRRRLTPHMSAVLAVVAGAIPGFALLLTVVIRLIVNCAS